MPRIFLVLLVCLPALLSAGDPARITYMTEDYPPENYLEGGQLKGYAVDILKALWKKMGTPEQPILVYPWARAYETVKSTPDTMLFAMMRTRERETLFKWVGPIFQARVALFCLDSKKFPATKTADLYGYRTGVIRKDVGASILAESGFPRESIKEVNSLGQLVQMLVSDRIDFICTTEKSLREYQMGHKDQGFRYREVLELVQMNVFYAFNKDTDQDLVNSFQAALDSMDSLRREIIGRYNYSE